ncbi:MAG: cysteine--tRNA ligase [Candidatus Omnitrophota bacterium]
MAIVLKNSLTKKKEEFVPLVSGEIKIYSCGVTVYDDCHVGHARSLFIFDALKKYLEYRGYKVKLVRNITDVDDKIINRAKQDGVEFALIRQRYIDNYYRDLKDFEVEKADFEPLATENIFYMTDHIKRLMEKGFAYEVDGDVYFAVRSFAHYGQLSGQSLDDMMTAVRIDKDEKKRDSLDFALWKKSKPDEPSWSSSWGQGRPGWHIECSTMSMRYLRTETLDIHAGGRDLIFPHHENEIAQAEALTGKTFARYWIHHGLLTINGKKMSKSLGNFVTIQDALKKYKPDVLKLFFLSAHYGSAMDFSYEAIDKTRKAYEKIEEFLSKAASLKLDPQKAGEACKEEVLRIVQQFEMAVDDDFNTAQGLAVLFELLTLGNRYLSLSQSSSDAAYVADCFLRLAHALGLSLKISLESKQFSDSERIKIADTSSMKLDREKIEELILERRMARQDKNYKRADEIRDFLKANGVILEDTQKS